MLHLQTSFYFALIAASPYIVFKLFRYISPALYEHEKRYSFALIFTAYFLFALGFLMNYFVVFPFSFRFLGTYQVDSSIANTITLSSYVSSFTTLSLVMGLVFQIPILAYFLGKFGLITAEMLKKYRRYALFVIVIVAAIITPPDIFSCIMTTIPMYFLYEVSIWVVRKTK
jgi:sec-independent protein translocase protein TatC